MGFFLTFLVLRVLTLKKCAIVNSFSAPLQHKPSRLLSVLQLRNAFKDWKPKLCNVIIKKVPLSPSLCGRVGANFNNHQLANKDGLITLTSHPIISPPGLSQQLIPELHILLSFVSAKLTSVFLQLSSFDDCCNSLK